MRKVLPIGGALAWLAASAAFAADLPFKARPQTASVPAWTGLYFGGNIGGAWGRSQTDSVLECSLGSPCYIESIQADINAQRFQTVHGSGFTGGVQAGYNAQYGRFVVGVEADFNAFRLSGTRVVSAPFTGDPVGGPPPTYSNAFSTNWLFTGRGRLGFAWDNWLLYGTAGVAATDLTYTHVYAQNSAVQGETSSVSKVRFGAAIGGGLEYQWSSNWSVKAEYLYLSFEKIHSFGRVVTPTVLTGMLFTHNADLQAHIARVGINYRLADR
jgi:outer membrane immunogenic protein